MLCGTLVSKVAHLEMQCSAAADLPLLRRDHLLPCHSSTSNTTLAVTVRERRTREVGHELGVRFVVEGTICEPGSRSPPEAHLPWRLRRRRADCIACAPAQRARTRRDGSGAPFRRSATAAA